MRFRMLKNLDKRREKCVEYRISYEIPEFDLSKIDSYHSPLDFVHIFGNGNPIVLEIGCGKGQFASLVCPTVRQIGRAHV